MIENEMLFLGLLVQGPKHGYEIKRQVQEDISLSVGIQVKSIYYPLKKLEEANLIEKETGRQGKFPEKYVYRITSKGRHRFDELLSEGFTSIERPFFQMDLCLYFLPIADYVLAKRKLKVRLGLLKRIARDLTMLKEKSLQGSRSVSLILQHSLSLVEAEIIATDKLIKEL